MGGSHFLVRQASHDSVERVFLSAFLCCLFAADLVAVVSILLETCNEGSERGKLESTGDGVTSGSDTVPPTSFECHRIANAGQAKPEFMDMSADLYTTQYQLFPSTMTYQSNENADSKIDICILPCRNLATTHTFGRNSTRSYKYSQLESWKILILCSLQY